VIEIRMLHKRIDGLESAASIDMLTKLFTHKEMVARIRARQAPCRLLLLEANGINTAEERFGGAVAEELTGAVIRRLRNNLPTSSAVGRWSDQGFVVILDLDSQDAGQLASRIIVNLAGSYACLKEGRTVRPPVQLRVELLEHTALGPDETLRQAADFFGE
jgi:GGDEF domain-containing protein